MTRKFQYDENVVTTVANDENDGKMLEIDNFKYFFYNLDHLADAAKAESQCISRRIGFGSCK